MGKKIIVYGADFSENGIITNQSIGVLTDFGSNANLGNYTWILSTRVAVNGSINKVSNIL